MMAHHVIKYAIIIVLTIGLLGAASLGGDAVSENPQIWALIIGISNYESPVFRLNYAHRDALLFKQTLTQTNLLPPDHIRFLINENATKKSINEGLQWLKTIVKPEDSVIIYFSGHGTVVYDPNYERKFPNGLLPWDAEEKISTNDIPYTEFTHQIDQIPSYETVVIIDACYSGGLIDVLSPNNFANNQIEPNITYLLSCEANQVAKESHGLQQSVFTHYLLKGLQGEANQDGGRICVVELYNYLQGRLAGVGQWQRPLLIQKNEHDVYLTGFNPTLEKREYQTVDLVEVTVGGRVKSPLNRDDVWNTIYQVLKNKNETVSTGTLVVRSFPPGAMVQIDGISIGKSPIKYLLRPGEHMINISREGYDSINQKIEINAGATYTLRTPLRKK